MNDFVDMYIFVPDEDIDCIELFRITKEIVPQVYQNGEWVVDKTVLSYYPDPTPGKYITKEEAQIVMKMLDNIEGGKDWFTVQ